MMCLLYGRLRCVLQIEVCGHGQRNDFWSFKAGWILAGATHEKGVLITSVWSHLCKAFDHIIKSPIEIISLSLTLKGENFGKGKLTAS